MTDGRTSKTIPKLHFFSRKSNFPKTSYAEKCVLVTAMAQESEEILNVKWDNPNNLYENAGLTLDDNEMLLTPPYSSPDRNPIPFT